MSKTPTRKKTPFVIEPLNWVAPDAERSDDDSRQKETSDKEQDSKS